MKLYNDVATFTIYENREIQLNKILKKLEDISDSTLGKNKIDNYKLMLSSPAEYFVEMYWELWAKKTSPPHFDKALVFEAQTKVSKSELTNLKLQFDNALKELGTYAPTINAKGLKSNLDVSLFDKFLNPEKAKEYDALLNLLKSAKELQTFGFCSGGINLMRFCGNRLQMFGLELKPNYNLYI